MKKELKKAIIDFIFEEEKEFQLHNATIEKFRPLHIRFKRKLFDRRRRRG